MASGQNVGVESAERGGGNHDRDFGDAGGLSGDDCHQQAGRIRRRSARDADAYPSNRPIQQAQLNPVSRGRHHIVMPDRLLIRQNILPHACDRLEIARIGLRWAVLSSSAETRTWPGSSVTPSIRCE